MIIERLAAMTVEQLVERYLSITLRQDAALEKDDNATYNRLFGEMLDVRSELKTRDGDQRIALSPLLAHRNAQVRLMAAIAMLKVAPSEARGTLQRLVDQKDYPQAYDAKGMLMSLDEGRYVPT